MGIPNFFTDRNFTPSQAFECLQGAGRHVAKCSELLSVEYRPTENPLVVALVVLSTPHFSIPRCLLELLCFVFNMSEYIHIN